MSIGIAVRPQRLEPARVAILGVTAALVGFAIAEAVLLYSQITVATSGWYIGMDYDYYREVGARWLTDGSYYWPHQLAGPYDVRLMVDVLYPPTALVLFVPLVFLPAVVWWIVPLGVIGYALWRWRPDVRVWPVLVLLAMWPRAMGTVFHGNTDMWVAAGIAGGLLWGWPAAFVVLKPIFAPLALVGIRRRSWWFAAALGLASIVVMLPLWRDYVVAMVNLRIGLDYSLTSLPLMAIPIVAWVARRASVDAGERLSRVPDPQEVERGGPAVRVVRGEPHAD